LRTVQVSVKISTLYSRNVTILLIIQIFPALPCIRPEFGDALGVGGGIVDTLLKFINVCGYMDCAVVIIL
jgi:hypothetical protein